MNYIRVDNGNKGDFASVLPENYVDGIGVDLAAYENDGTFCGAVSLSYGTMQYDLDWLYVVPEKRLSGIGTGLLREVKRMVASIGICPIRALFDASEDNGLYRFFLSASSPDLLIDVDYSHDRYIVTAEDFLSSELMKDKHRMDYVPAYFWELDEGLREKALEPAMDHLTITNLKAFEESCEKNLCYTVEKDGRILSLMLLQKDNAENLTLSYLYSVDGKALMSMLMPAAMELKKNHKGKEVRFDVVTEEAARLAGKIFPEAERKHMYEADF